MTPRATLKPVLIPALCALLASTSAAAADPVDTGAAREQLYRADRVEVVRYHTSGLDEEELQVLTTVAQSQKYYAALAFAPEAGIMAEPTVMSANFHNIEAAREAALSTCNERRSGGARCVIAMEVRPQGWEPRDLQLSADATTHFNDDYRRATGTRAFAISASTGQWGVALGDGAQDEAVTACQGETNVSDCAVVIAD
ncbi:5-aminolevulic acid synthase [Pararhodobacter oceanensis]|uniref:5-aminolevulic acid synthase n=1 Tax=Pararhodobacter oceanensis TaxID=2172121 RepID=UPI003A9392EF